jgi:uncharacterized BrkB/YihY/UPF0761 family membrane protein
LKKAVAQIAALVPIALLVFAIYSLFAAPSEPSADWRLHMTQEQHDLMVAPIDHAYRVAAYSVTWAIQLGYLAWLGLKWSAQKQLAARPGRQA